MYSAEFDYQRAGSVAEAVSLLSQNSGAKIIAGGHSLLPAMKLRLSQPPLLIDIGRIGELKQISVSGNTLTIGALCTHSDIATSADVQTHCAALAAACGSVGDPHVRNWGTLGGNLAHADPASDPPTAVLACNAIIHMQGPNGTRTISADDFFLDLFTTDLQPDEMITRLTIPSLKDYKSAYFKLAHPASRYALVGVGVVLAVDGGTCKQARIAVGGVTPKATRMRSTEAALIGSTFDEAALDKAAQAMISDIGDDASSDIYASSDYRTAMAGVYLKRAVRAALK